VQAKCQIRAHSSYSGRGILCNGFFARALDHVLGEALAGETSGRSRAPTELRDDPTSAFDLGLELIHRGLDSLAIDAPADQVVPDQGISRPAAGERAGPRAGEAEIVDRSCVGEPRDRLFSQGRRNPCAREARMKLGLGQVTRSE
jgi:hypothetical protein